MRRLMILLSIVTILVLTLGACVAPADAPTARPTEATAAGVTPETTTMATAMVEDSSTEAGAATACMPGAGSIAVLLPDSTSSPRWENDDRRFFTEALTAASVPYTIVNAQGDAANQQVQAAQALAEGASVLVLVNLDSISGAAIIAEARASGARVVDDDRLTIEGPGADIYVSVDGYAVGAAMGATLEPLINALDKAAPRVVQLNGAPADNNATLVRLGYASLAQPYYDAGQWQLAGDVAVPGWDEAQAQSIFAQLLAEAGEEGVDAVFAANDGLADAVVTTLQAQGLAPILVSGQDATVTGLQNILAGWQSMTVYKPLRAEANAAVDAALALLNCDDPTPLAQGNVINNGTSDIPYVKLAPVVVTKANMGETVIADGFRTWEQICVGEYEALCPVKR
jgi:D-xylose transport system substrate-binding protein